MNIGGACFAPEDISKSRQLKKKYENCQVKNLRYDFVYF